MADAVPHPYAVEVSPVARPPGAYTWTIRKNGRVIERSDRTYASEAKAHEQALEAIERDRTFSGQSGSVRR